MIIENHVMQLGLIDVYEHRACCQLELSRLQIGVSRRQFEY